jgi:hypothetical protein
MVLLARRVLKEHREFKAQMALTALKDLQEILAQTEFKDLLVQSVQQVQMGLEAHQAHQVIRFPVKYLIISKPTAQKQP